MSSACAGDEINPGPEVQTDEEIAGKPFHGPSSDKHGQNLITPIEWIMKNANTTYHTASSLSMLPREKNGVVDPELKVYGTKNIRVADLSIVPLHFSAHSQGECRESFCTELLLTTISFYFPPSQSSGFKPD